MKKYLIIAFVLLSFAGCKTPLKVTDSQEVKVTDKTQVVVTEKQESKSEVEVNTSRITEKAKNTVTTSKVTEYNTEKPINPDTGKPPVKSETETTQTITTGEKEQESTTTSTLDTTSYQATDNSKKDIQAEVEQEYSQKKQLPSIFWYAVSAIGVGVLVLIFWSKLSGWLKRLFAK